MRKKNDLPATWKEAPLSNVVNFCGGGTPSKSDSSYWTEGTVPWVSPKDMKSFVISKSEDLVAAKALEKLTLIPADSVLVVVRSGILSRTLPVAVNTIPVTINQDMRAILPEKGMSYRYLAWQLVSREREILADCSKHGTTVASIEGPALARFPLAIAPTAEQLRIVEKLEELFSDLDAGVDELKAAQEKLAQYRQSLLKAAVEGELSIEWRAQRGSGSGTAGKIETGAELLKRILSERRRSWEEKQLERFKQQGKTPPKGWQENYREPVEPDTEPVLPEGWGWATVDQLCPDDIANGKSVPTACSGPKVLRLTAVRAGKIDLNQCKHGSWSEKEALPFYVRDGDVLVVRGNGSLSLVGRCGLVGGVTENVAYPDTMIRVRLLNQIVLPSWFQLVWDSTPVRDHLQSRARTSAGIYKIAQPDIVSAKIPVPPFAEQQAICDMFQTANEEIAAMEKSISEGLSLSIAQRWSILKAAFSGQLVSQDPNDEPASVLLDRICSHSRSQKSQLVKSRTKVKGKRA